MRNRLFQEGRARDCQEIEELRRFCCEEEEKARQSRNDELSLKQERSPSVVTHFMSQIEELQKVNSLPYETGFHDPEGSSRSGASYVPSRPLTIPSRIEKSSREPAMPNDTRNAMSTSGNVFEAYLLEKDNPHLASRIPGIRHYLRAK